MDKNYSLIKQINREFHFVDRQIIKKEKKAIKASGINITHRELEYIVCIKDFEGKKLNKVLPTLDINKSTWSLQLKTLQNKGLVIVTTDKVDKRVKRTKLTKKGNEAYEVHKKVRLEILEDYKDVMTEKELIEMLKISAKILNRIREKQKKEYNK